MSRTRSPDTDPQADRGGDAAAAAGLYLRVCWLVRALIPQVVAVLLLQKLVESFRPSDLDPWKSFDFSSIDLDVVVANMAGMNIVTKVMLAVVVIVVSVYATDLLTTGRRSGWCLIAHPTDPSRWKHFAVWIGLVVSAATLLALAYVLVVTLEFCRVSTVFKLMMAVYFLALFAGMIVNRNFDAYMLLVPTFLERREARFKRRTERRREQFQRKREKREKSRQQRDLLRERRAELLALQHEYKRLGAEVHALEASDHPPHLVAEQVARLNAERGRVRTELEHRSANYPDRA